MAELQAQTSAKEDNARITGELRRHREGIRVAIPLTELDLRHITHDFELRLASLYKRAQDIDESIHSADAWLENHPHLASSQALAATLPAAPIPPIPAASQSPFQASLVNDSAPTLDTR